ncbi:phage tail tape measure protein [Enterococcus sp. E4-152]|uniref:phage tail tape measure protein n=1 Tax=Enterococcus sp. E4-152 TaxID=3002965 RepID=UPI002D7FF6ED|nr:phage tail tape measure protein [Enterococcus sp. E4-152]MEB4777664.1 phage tail tape measure protein [Enterococcus sp. E4-152]
MAQSYSVTAVLEAVDKSFSSTYASAEKTARNFETATQGINKTMGASGEKMQKAGETMTGWGDKTKWASAAAVGALGFAAKSYMDLESAQKSLQARAGLTGGQMKHLTALSKEWAAESVFGATDVLAMFEDLITAGMSYEDSQKAVKNVMEMVAATQMDQGDATNFLVGIMANYNLEANKAQQITDALVQSSKDSSATADEMKEGFEYCASSAANAGLSYESTAAALGILNDAGLRGSKAGTALESMLRQIKAPTDAARNAMDQLGISFYDNNGKMKSLSDIVENVDGKIGNLTQEEQDWYKQLLFGTEGQRAFNGILAQGTDKLDENTKSLENCKGVAKKTSEELNKGLTAKLDNFKETVTNAAIAIGEKLAPAIDKMLDFATNLVNNFAELDGGTLTWITGILALVAVLSPALIIIGKTITAVGQIVTGVGKFIGILGKIPGAAMKVWGGLQKLFALVMAHPFVAITVAIIALIAYFVHLYNTNEEFRKKVDECWNAVKETVKSSVEQFKRDIDDIKRFFTEGWETVKTKASEAWEAIKGFPKSASDYIKQTWEGTKQWFADTWEGIKQGAVNKWEELKQGVVNKCNNLVDGAQRAWDNFKQGVSDAVDRAIGFFDRLWNIDLAAAGRAIIDGFLNGIKEKFESVKSFVGGIADWIKDHKGPISYDKRLLIPAGKAIMNGLLGGLESKFGAVQNFVKSVTACLSDTSVTNGINSAINDVNPTMTIDRNTKSRVRHEIDGSSAQPAYITLSMGGQTYKAFVSDIFDENNSDVDLRVDTF